MGRRRTRVTLTPSIREYLDQSAEVDKLLNDLYLHYCLAEASANSPKYWVVNRWKPKMLLSVLWYDTQALIYSRERLYRKTLSVDGLPVLMEDQLPYLPIRSAVVNISQCLATSRTV